VEISSIVPAFVQQEKHPSIDIDQRGRGMDNRPEGSPRSLPGTKITPAPKGKDWPPTPLLVRTPHFKIHHPPSLIAPGIQHWADVMPFYKNQQPPFARIAYTLRDPSTGP